MKNYIAFLLIASFAVSNALTDVATASETSFVNRGAIETVVKRAKENGFVGTIAISNADQMIYVTGVGDAISGRARYGGETVVDIASVSKQFTGAAILKLEQDGLLSIDDTIDKYFPSAGPDKRAITLHQLLTHTAGFQHHLGRDEEAITKEAYVERAISSDLVQKPGQGYYYSNVGYSLLAAIIEAVSGQSYEDYLFTALWQPAGMFDTGYLRPDWSGRDVPTLKQSYAGMHSALEIVRKNGEDNWHLFGNGGVLSTAADMMKWHGALVGQSILSDAAKAKLFASHVPETDDGFYYGYGWSIQPGHPQGRLVWHNGMSFFGKAEFWRFPESGLAIFVASHAGDVSPWTVADDLAAAINAG